MAFCVLYLSTTNLEASYVQLLRDKAPANVASTKMHGCFRHVGGVEYSTSGAFETQRFDQVGMRQKLKLEGWNVYSLESLTQELFSNVKQC